MNQQDIRQRIYLRHLSVITTRKKPDVICPQPLRQFLYHLLVWPSADYHNLDPGISPAHNRGSTNEIVQSLHRTDVARVYKVETGSKPQFVG